MKSGRFKKTGMILLFIAALINLFLGGYHLTTREGWRSGITELVSTVLLAIAIYLFSKSGKT